MTTQMQTQTTTAPDQRLAGIGLGIGRIVVGLLWFSQLWWKLPPTFGCPADFKFSTRDQFTSGLCDWIGREAAYAGNLRVFNLDLHLIGQPNFSVDLSFLSSAYGAFLRGFVIPNFSWMAWIIFATELFITVTILFGILARLGALVGTAQALNLTIGLLPVPAEWEWTYIMLTTLNFVLLMTAAGRHVGIDARLHPWAVAQAAKGNSFAKVAQWMT
ncbi:MAG: hypothetical protein A2Z03_02010 [Chloroflexi bacterium RBG_16_56_8]|nr:MAG: hypothetical protein A2Z03_02010 [Chloroflexi bacterium RBG_16_56_8]